MPHDPTETPRTTVRIPQGCLGINLAPAFGGGYIIRFSGPGGSLLDTEVYAPASVTFDPDGTLSYPVPLTPAS